MCRSLSQELTRPELRAMFTYLSTQDWTAVLYESIDLQEKLLIALRYFSDHQLMDYINTATNVAITEGDLNGIVFTGLAGDGVDLIARFVDTTGDIQTAALATAFASQKRIKEHRVNEWIEEYRDFLDHLQLFHERALFDIACCKVSGTENFHIAPQIHVRCNFCNQSVSQSVFLPGIKDKEGRRVALAAATMGSLPKYKVSFCISQLDGLLDYFTFLHYLAFDFWWGTFINLVY
jgi:hypothetical protein